MPTPAASLRARFVEDGVSAAPPQVLLVNLYDRLLVDLRQGAAAMRDGDRQVSHNKLVNAQAIVSGLKVALDGGDWEGTRGLQGLYSYLLVELAQANVAMDADRVEACVPIVEPLREAWYQAALSLSASAGAGAPQTGLPSGGATA